MRPRRWYYGYGHAYRRGPTWWVAYYGRGRDGRCRLIRRRAGYRRADAVAILDARRDLRDARRALRRGRAA